MGYARATISFYIPSPANDENAIFGEWEAYSSARILEETRQDTLVFEVTRVRVESDATISAFVLNLFLLLLVATGIFTFALLFMLRR